MPKIVVESHHIAAARLLAKNACTADELRRAQAILLPVDFHLSMAQTAQAIGRTVGVATTLRKAFGKGHQHTRASCDSHLEDPKDSAFKRERLLLGDALRDAAATGDLTVARIKLALEARTGATVALSTVYRTLARHGWRKNAPFPLDLLTEEQRAAAEPHSCARSTEISAIS